MKRKGNTDVKKNGMSECLGKVTPFTACPTVRAMCACVCVFTGQRTASLWIFMCWPALKILNRKKINFSIYFLKKLYIYTMYLHYSHCSLSPSCSFCSLQQIPSNFTFSFFLSLSGVIHWGIGNLPMVTSPKRNDCPCLISHQLPLAPLELFTGSISVGNPSCG